MRDVRLGRWRGPTISDSIAEALGHEIELAGDSARRTTRRARQLKLVIPIHGEQGDADPRATALRMRRQLRAYVNNDEALRDLYLALTYDSEIDGWVVLGNADVEDAADGAAGGAALGEFKATLDLHVDGRLRTNRLGRRLELEDRRLASVPRDHCGRVYSTDFAAQPALSVLTLPVGVSDVLDSARRYLNPIARPTRDGNLGLVVGSPDGDAVTYAQAAPADQLKGNVVILDRRGNTAPAETLAGSNDPQTVYGWEEVYGPDQPLTAGDVPVLDNGRCRVRYVAATKSFALDQWVGTGNGWSEVGRVTLWRDLATVRFDALISASVLEWTPARAVLKVIMELAPYPNDTRVEAIITLEAGWSGPRVEAYGSWGPGYPGVGEAAKPGVRILFSPFDAGAMYEALSAGGLASDTEAWPYTGTATLAAYEPWVFIQAVAAGASPAVTLAVLQGSVRIRRDDDTAAYGSTRKAVGMTRPGDLTNPSDAGYVSVTFGVGAGGYVREAEAHRVVGATATQVADGAASAGQAVEDTQVTEASQTLNNFLPGVGRWLVMARVRVVNGGATGSFQLRRSGDALALGVVTTTSTGYIWIVLTTALDLTAALPAFNINGWRSAGTGAVRLDRVIAVPLERRVAGANAYDGARDVAQANLYDQRAIPFLVER